MVLVLLGPGHNYYSLARQRMMSRATMMKMRKIVKRWCFCRKLVSVKGKLGCRVVSLQNVVCCDVCDVTKMIALFCLKATLDEVVKALTKVFMDVHLWFYIILQYNEFKWNYYLLGIGVKVLLTVI